MNPSSREASQRQTIVQQPGPPHPAAAPGIACSDPSHAVVLEAARDGNVPLLRGMLTAGGRGREDALALLWSAECESGCFAIHWAAGSNQVEALRFFLDPQLDGGNVNTSSSVSSYCWLQPIFEVDTPAAGRSRGRTALHYAARNGCADALKLLVEHYGADPDAPAKHGVTPFQLAVWRNQISIAQTLVQQYGVDPCQTNDFGCNAAHWACISPLECAGSDDGGMKLLPLLRWLNDICGASLFRAEQRQGHSSFHKACWLGHWRVVEWLHEECDLWDDRPDLAGNYGVDLCRMANTERHRRLEIYLRSHCSRQVEEWCRIMGLDLDVIRPLLLHKSCSSDNSCREERGNDVEAYQEEFNASAELTTVLRRAYLQRIRLVHPDKKDHRWSRSCDSAAVGRGSANEEFYRVHDAYCSFMSGGLGTQGNPNHRLPLLLRDRPEPAGCCEDGQNQGELGSSASQSFRSSAAPATASDHATSRGSEAEASVDSDRFKTQLLVVLKEYGDKGMNASNLKKKWKQIWSQPFPDTGDKSTTLLRYLSLHAGDVISVYRNSKTGQVRVHARNQK